MNMIATLENNVRELNLAEVGEVSGGVAPKINPDGTIDLCIPNGTVQG